jgi:hypothetical protein
MDFLLGVYPTLKGAAQLGSQHVARAKNERRNLKGWKAEKTLGHTQLVRHEGHYRLQALESQRRRWRAASKRMMLVATATFRDSAPPCMGMLSEPVANSRASRPNP